MDMKLELPGQTRPADITRLASVSTALMSKIRDDMLEPLPRKRAPVLSSARVQEICGIDRRRMNYVVGKGELPAGHQPRAGAARSFTIEDTIQWVRAEGKPVKRKGGAKVVAVANFKGGVTKTTTAMVLGQGLTFRRGRRVLVVDLDPQGSLTTLFGINPHTDIEATQTIYALAEAYSEEREADFDMKSLPLKTYWPDLDLIPSTTDLFNAEFMLPARARKDGAKSSFQTMLSDALGQLKEDYDYIIIDTPPTLSYLTMNAIYAADGVIVPVMPDVLSLASMAQFWQLFADLVTGMEAQLPGAGKGFDFLDILITKMEQKESPQVVRDWIREIYGARVLPIEIPETDTAGDASLRFSTVYDLSTVGRIRPATDRLVDIVDDKFSAIWNRG